MSTRFSCGTGIINVVNSNPNGDADAETEPRTFDDRRGLISPVIELVTVDHGELADIASYLSSYYTSNNWRWSWLN